MSTLVPFSMVLQVWYADSLETHESPGKYLRKIVEVLVRISGEVPEENRGSFSENLRGST